MTECIDKRLLSELLGIAIHAVDREPVPTGGLHSRIYACKSAEDNLILRVCSGTQGFYTQYFPELVDWSKRVDQHWATNRAREVEVPAPEIMYSNGALRWVVMKRLPGVPIDSRYEMWQGCPYDEKEFGTLLGRLHSITPSGYGPIDDDGVALFPTWGEFLAQAATSAIRTCRSRGSLPAVLCDSLERNWTPVLRSIEVERPSLLHMESLGFANILYDPGTRRITGLLDYEDCLGGDPLFEIVWMQYYFQHDTESQTYFHFEQFQSGYGQLVQDSARTMLYEPFPYLDKLRWIPTDRPRAQSYIERLEEILARIARTGPTVGPVTSLGRRPRREPRR